MTKTKPALLARRFNKDGTVSLLCRGRVVAKYRDYRSVIDFACGWYGVENADQIKWGRSQFA
jgi:hypothetical protein